MNWDKYRYILEQNNLQSIQNRKGFTSQLSKVIENAGVTSGLFSDFLRFEPCEKSVNWPVVKPLLNNVTELELMRNAERLTPHKYRCAKLVAAHPRWHKSVTRDSSASIWYYWIKSLITCVEFQLFFFCFIKLYKNYNILLLHFMGCFVNANGRKNTFTAFKLSRQQNKTWRKRSSLTAFRSQSRSLFFICECGKVQPPPQKPRGSCPHWALSAQLVWL